MTEAEQERARVVAWARMKASLHHNLAVEAKDDAAFRTQHVALSSAYLAMADALESGDHLKGVE